MSDHLELASAPGVMPALSFPQMAERYNALVKVTKEIMKEGRDYGKIPGTDKPTLLKPGAEKLCTLFGLSPRFEVVESRQDWDAGLFYYWYKCQLFSGGAVVAEGEGSANSKEKKYRWRTVFDNKATEEEKAVGKLETRQSKNGKPYKVYVIENTEPYDLINTLQKMAQKRCLGGTTQVFIKTSRGVSLTNIKTMYAIYETGNEDICVPGISGDWRQVEAMIEDKGREVWRLDLADGSYIRATPEHRFPTASGLKHVRDLHEGDVLCRSALALPTRSEITATYNQKELAEIVSVERESKPGTVYDIQVDGDHLFCLANGIQTHNSLIAAALIAVNASEFFTQDMEDFIDVPFEAAPETAAPIERKPPAKKPAGLSQEKVQALMASLAGAGISEHLTFAASVIGHELESLSDLNTIEAKAVYEAAQKPAEDAPAWAAWKNDGDALTWAQLQGVFDHPTHRKNAFDKLKGEVEEGDLYPRWYDDVLARQAEKEAA